MRENGNPFDSAPGKPFGAAPGKPGPRQLGSVLKTLLKSAPWSKRTELHALSEAWCRAAGPEVASRTRIVGLARGTLTVSVESAALRCDIEGFRKGEILMKLRHEYPTSRIAALRCVLRTAP